MQLESDTDRGVKGFQVVKHAAFKPGVNTPVNELDRPFHESLVSWFANPGGNDNTPVMLGKSREILVQFCLVTTRLVHGRFQIVRDDNGRGTPVKKQG